MTATTRRDFLRDAAFAGGSAAAFAAGAAPVAAALPGRTRRARREVAVLGGGVGGLTAAHELVERGFRVTVYEKQAWGGKARSIPVPHTAHGERRPLPGKHRGRDAGACLPLGRSRGHDSPLLARPEPLDCG
ncbi:MAG: FAD-dependent oxidoreductase [Chloroflexi bacterium]|nr:MAG: FAD-dependent oxidoreductase [Chloroflexota bacterium]